jgi:peptide deformylase
MPLNEIVKLGDPLLLRKSEPVDRDEIPGLMPVIEKMMRLIEEFRSVYGRGRAMAAPQAGILKRIICLNTDKKTAMINPVISVCGDETMEVWDDCMSFPELLVRVTRYRKIEITFYDTDFVKHQWLLEDDMAELLQHEYDHLDGILAIMRAKGIEDFRWSEEKL